MFVRPAGRIPRAARWQELKDQEGSGLPTLSSYQPWMQGMKGLAGAVSIRNERVNSTRDGGGQAWQVQWESNGGAGTLPREVKGDGWTDANSMRIRVPSCRLRMARQQSP